MTRALVVVCFAAAAAVPAARQQTAPNAVPPVRGFEQFQAWSREVWTHVPGRWDEPALVIAAWPAAELEELRIHLSMLATLVSREKASNIRYTPLGDEVAAGSIRVPANTRLIRRADVPALIGVPKDALTDERITEFFKRAALLHTDVVLLAREEEVQARRRLSPGRSGASGAGRNARSVRMVLDGQDAGFVVTPVHWEIARAALDGVRPAADGDPLTRAWYRGVAAHLAGQRQFGYLAPHLARGRLMFLDDGWLQFVSGILHESLAAPSVQTALEALKSVRDFRANVAPVTGELTLAEGFFRRAIEIDSSFAIARLHLGRVLGLLGRHDQAVVELSQALPLLAEDFERYYAYLFLGVEEEARGQPALAQAAYERARDLFPKAQAPHLALSQLAWQRADRDGALDAFRALAGLGKGEERGGDPWWSYHWSVEQYAEPLLQSMWQAAARELRR